MISASLYLKKGEILKLLKDEEQKKWFLEKGIHAPSNKLRRLSGTLEDVGVKDVSAWTERALALTNTTARIQRDFGEVQPIKRKRRNA